MEILVTVATIAVLVALCLGGYGHLLQSGKQTKELAAGKSLIAAYLNYAADNNGLLMVAHYEGSSPEVDTQQITLPDGTVLSGGTLHRYPYRLSPYYDYTINGVILVNENRQQVSKLFSGGMLSYGTSLCPAFGINYYFVGGYKVDNELSYPSETATRLSQVGNPSSLLVFATAYQQVEGHRVDGRFGVEPPRFRTALWDQNLHVDPRHNGKVLCAFLDGSLRHYSVDELRDMRLWSFRAAANNDPNYTVAASGSGGIGGGGGRR